MKRGMWIYLFPLTVLAFVAPAVQYANAVFTPSNRWAFGGVLLLVLVLTGRALVIVFYDVGAALGVYVGWSVLTYFWSEVPDLTLMKSFALALVSIGLLAGGQYWVSRVGWRSTLDYLLPMVALAVFAGALGQAAVSGSTAELELYYGLTDNPNMLGSLMNMAVPCVLWQAYRFRDSKKWMAVWLALLALIVGVLLMSIARASILAAVITCGMFVAAIGVRRNVALIAIAAIAAASAVIAIPDVFDILEQRYIRKAAAEAEVDVLASRADVWGESYDQAVKGGIVGGGYGVTIGDTDFVGGLTAVGYGREKGNSQLAIVEETGVVGLLIYLAFLALLFRRASFPLRQTHDRDMKVMGALLLGTLIGQIAQSTLEAWWVAPGSPESAYFWALAGVVLGLSIESRKRPAAARPPAVPADRHLSPERPGALLRRRS